MEAGLRMRSSIYLAFCLLLSGCLVLPESFYLPVSDTGQLEKPVCGKYGPYNSILFELDGVWVRIWLRQERYKKQKDFKIDLPSRYKIGEKYLVLGVSIVGAPDSVAVVKDREIGVRVHPAESKKFAFNSFYRTENIAKQTEPEIYQQERRIYTDIQVGEQLVFAPREGHFDTIYWGDIWLDAQDSESIQMDHIEIEVNGRQLAIAHVDFVKKTGLYDYWLGC
jgi:hypothetical protein